METAVTFLIWLLVVTTLSVGVYRATRFEYELTHGNLEIQMVWGGLFRIPRRVPLSRIKDVRQLKSLREIVPVMTGTFPTLWGKFTPSKMVIISFKRINLFPLVITPDAPEEFINRLSPLIEGS